jgi:uncharacterized membrane-anchored protein
MYTSSKTSFVNVFIKPAAFLWLLSISTFFLAQYSRAGQSSLWSMAPSEQTPVDWTPGPADASLGSIADIRIPRGYRFTDATGASALLQKMNNPVPQGLIGILAPESGQWWAILRYQDIGYVKGADKDKIDAATILQTISERAQRQNEDRRMNNLPLITSVNWALSPVLDAKTHTVEWAVRAKTQSSEVINQTICLLGRQGMLSATAVELDQVQPAAGLLPLKELMKNISFNPGQRYTDYQKGDKISDLELAGIVSGRDNSSNAQKDDVAASSDSTKNAGILNWYMYILIGVLAGGGVMLGRGILRRRRGHHSLSPSPMGNGSVHANAYAGSTAQTQTASNNSFEIHAAQTHKPKIAVTENGSMRRRPAAHRKKVFDYHRFYADTVMKLSSSGYTGEIPVHNGMANGRSSAHSMGAQSLFHGDTNPAIIQANLDLIANQKELIEKQKHLMIQQARLIEEKSKLIAEKNQLLDRQTELFERDVL